MIISGGFQCIYVRVPRTGSSTFVQTLENTLGVNYKTGFEDQHFGARKIQSLFPRQWKICHTFAYIRDPWDWLGSVYNANVSAIPFPVKEVMPGAPHHRGMSFVDWLPLRVTTPIDWLTSDTGEIIVDEIRRMEDFTKNNPLHLRASINHAPYRSWYTEEMAQYVREKCYREIELGGYEF